MKKRKKKKLRDKFTDALGEEISSREALDLEKLEKSRAKDTPKVDLTKEVKPNTAAAITEIEAVKVDSDTTALEIVEVPVDAEFEKRVFAEADNHFHDEKPKRPGRRLTPENLEAARATFHAKMMQERIEEEKEAENKKDLDKDADLHRKLTRAETTGAVISVAMLVYSLATYDKPLFFMALSLFSHTMRPLIGAFFGKYNRPVQNALRSFSIALFFGALLFLVI